MASVLLSTFLILFTVGETSIAQENSSTVKAVMPAKHLTVFKMYCFECHDAGFNDKLKKMPEFVGTSLFDNVTLTFGSNLRLTHSLNNCPTLVAGGVAGFKHGRHLVMENKTPLCNLWLTTLRGSGVKAETFGDATGVIDELFEV